MINLSTIRNLVLAIALGLLVFAEVLHPVFHKQYPCSWQANQCLAAGTPCMAQCDAAVAYIRQKACPIYSSMLLKYYANDSTSTVLCDNQNTAVSSPLPGFIPVEINPADSPRAPPVLLS